MASRSAVLIGAGCLVLVLVGAVVAVAVAVALFSAPSLPSDLVIAVRLNAPIVERSEHDPLSELAGDLRISLQDLRDALRAAAADPRVRGLRLRIDSFSGSMATAQEIRRLLEQLRGSGKWSAAYLHTAGEFAPGNLEYYVASACDEVTLHPLGDLNVIGLSIRVPFAGGTLDKLRVRPQFPARGAYKTAGHLYTEEGFTEANQEMMVWLADSLMEQLSAGIASRRGLEVEAVQNLIDRAPFLGQEAVEVGLVDGLSTWSDFVAAVDERSPGRAHVMAFETYLSRRRSAASGPTIAVVTGVGTILRGESRPAYGPLYGGPIMGADTLANAWREVRRTPGVRAAVFRIDSPGGSPLASEIIRQEMARTAEEMPVVVSMAGTAASGGYWIACGADRLVAESATLTGSIGATAGHFNLSGLFNQHLGVSFGSVDRGANADLYGGLHDWDDRQLAVINRMLGRIYDAFVERVSEARGMTPDEVRAVGEGRVFTGAQAVANGLVDLEGGFDIALAEAKRLAGISPDVEVRLLRLPEPQPWWQRLWSGRRSADATALAAVDELAELAASGGPAWPGAVWMPPLVVR